MKKLFLVVAILLGLLVLIAIGAYLYVFVVGRLVDAEKPPALYVIVDDSGISLTVRFPFSATSFARYSYRIEGGNLYVRIYYVLIGSRGTFTIELLGDMYSDISNIYIEDRRNQRLIWSRDETP